MALRTVADLARLTGIGIYGLEYMAAQPVYDTFQVPKKSGGFRLIEDPADILKDLQRTLNEHLQCVYYLRRTPAAYAFQITAAGEEPPRNILTHARQHVGMPWMMNADFLDFFHQVLEPMVYQIFTTAPFLFPDKLALLLTQLTTYQGRLPMGAPTSPVLSNFAVYALDLALLELASQHGWLYTRFADDLTFSSQQPLTFAHLRKIRQISQTHGFVFNRKKVRIYSPDMPKQVTGLKVTDSVSLTDEYLPSVTREIDKLATVLEIRYRTGQREAPWIQKFQQQIEGHLEFTRYILGEQHPDYQQVQAHYQHAQKPALHYDPVSWLDFGYFHIL